MARGADEGTREEMKADLRQRIREEAARHLEERIADSRQICRRIRGQTVWREAKKVLLFVPIATEPDISDLMNDGKRVSLPSFNEQAGQYQAREISGRDDLVVGRFGILEPRPKCSLTDLGALDLVLAPGVAFALDGSRLGRGKGYYDRLLARIKVPKCGVCFDWQVLPEIPCDGHDVLMDYIATSSRWHVAKR